MTGILAALFLGEPYGWLEASSAALCMVGAALVSKPYILFGDSDGTPGEKTPTHDGQHEEINHSTTTLATCIVFLSAITASFTYTIVRKVGTKSHFLTLAVSTGYMMCFVSFPAVLFGIQDFVMPTSYKDYLLLLSVGFVAFIYQCLANLGVQLAPAGPATLMCMNDIVFAFIFGICFFDEYPDVLSVLGALLIMTMTSIVAVNKWKKN
ncbi:hypothetical protein BDB00DRAFT_832495 [Zychaea mexicana]|uniref:uncharacterized protein n=1 Tax=Zychaea mexicana TaxID=64656 RepID=UPI0022FDDFB2|nr:uncharacterized protein BDB00DRAFT_832495 [Zychaea mexicana]KAI9491496.1 hypothetical protein BDB00DRAFT_832495 [Zychaea mexicana]